ncbi:hypothetical protein DENSPDRAFT_802497 [Dentipellis sp. KUC8613]|nr:hypothetical protein DENSPDRAFT_802497 [Dentipellis sp. KUC8613]
MGVPSHNADDRAIRSYRTRWYPRYTWFIVGSFIFLLMLWNIATLIAARLRKPRPATADVEGRTRRQLGPVSYRRLHVAFLNACRVIAFRLTIPLGFGFKLNLAEVFLTGAYLAMLFVLAMIKTTSQTGENFNMLYWANRAGVMASLQTMLVVTLGMKNNPISYLTGISFDKLNYLHRMSSRAICILIWLHAGGWFQYGLVNGIAITTTLTRTGILGGVAIALLCIVSIRPVRQLEYEYFLIMHFCLALIYLIGGYVHTHILGVGSYIWPALAIWGVDRVLRAVRVIVFNHSYFGFKSGVGTFNATLETIADGYIRMRFRRPKHLRWDAAQSVYLTMPGVSTLPWEAHPFTIANADIPTLKHEIEEEEERSAEDEKVREGDVDEKEAGKVQAKAVGPSAVGKEMIFLINSQKGFTKRLVDIANKGGSLKIFIDGPYGHPPKLRGFDSVVFVSGGTGVTFTCPLFVDLVYRVRRNAAVCRYIMFIWVVRKPEHIKLVYEDLRATLTDLPSSLTVDVRIFVTSPDVPSLPDSERSSVATDVDGSSENHMVKATNLPMARVEKGRPDMKVLLDEARSLAVGNMSVNICGPGGLAEGVKKALASPTDVVNILRGGPSVDLFVEAFDYA